MKKKIGIITVSRTFNFGAELQAFALQYKLNLLGFDAEIIDYLYYKNNRYKLTLKGLPELSINKSDKIKKIILYHMISPIIDSFLPLFDNKTKERHINFKQFHERYSKFSKEYRSIKELYKANHDYDVFITGSDQVWNPATFTSLKPYLLDFAPRDKKRISYASSFGVTTVSNEYIDKYSELFNNYHSISVREESAKGVVQSLTDINSELVVDPTLLLSKDDWQFVTKNVHINISEPYILVYDLQSTKTIWEIVNKIKAVLKIQVYQICSSPFKNRKINGVINIENAGPAEFVSLFMNATFVVTNSFHGTAFSVNFNIPFVSLINSSKTNNSRILNFVTKFKLQKHLIYDGVFELDKIKNINFEQSNYILNDERVRSINFLIKNI